MHMYRCLYLVAGFAIAAPAFSAVGDAGRGRQVFENLKCATCHSVAGVGGKGQPDLALRLSRGNTPADLAAAMWSHAPKMWAAMDQAGVARGRKTFTEKGCAGCHAFPGQPDSAGPPVSRWASVSDPIELARQMWNHAPGMRAAMTAKGGKLPELTAAEMNDIITCLSSLPNIKARPGQFSPVSAETGQTLVEVKGCNTCHKGAMALPGKKSYTTAAEIASAMWNHAARMESVGQLRPEEMRRIVGYLWSRQFENEGGDSARGAKLFQTKACAGCHGSSAPYLAHGEESSSYGMVAVLWHHGPEMLRQMKTKNVAWPQFVGSDISDLIAFFKASK